MVAGADPATTRRTRPGLPAPRPRDLARGPRASRSRSVWGVTTTGCGSPRRALPSCPSARRPGPWAGAQATPGTARPQPQGRAADDPHRSARRGGGAGRRRRGLSVAFLARGGADGFARPTGPGCGAGVRAESVRAMSPTGARCAGATPRTGSGSAGSMRQAVSDNRCARAARRRWCVRRAAVPTGVRSRRDLWA